MTTTRDGGPPEDEEGTELARRMDDEAQLIRTDVSTLSALNKSEVEAQLDAAHRWPRSYSKFEREATTLAISSQEVAKSCMYTLERRDKDGKPKPIIGPSVRLAEICASTYGNLHAGARPVDIDDTTVTSQGVCWDVERNVRVVTETKRRITNSRNKRYGEDMIIVTQNAASSIALRNAIFRVIPRSLVDKIFLRVRQVATGDMKTMEQKRAEIVEAFGRLGIGLDRVLAKLERADLGDVTIEDIEILIGYGTRIKDGDNKDELFPKIGGGSAEVKPAEEGKRQPLKRPPPAAATTPGATTPPAAKKPEDSISKPVETDEDAAARRAAEPTPEEIAAHEAEKARAAAATTSTEETPPWKK